MAACHRRVFDLPHGFLVVFLLTIGTSFTNGRLNGLSEEVSWSLLNVRMKGRIPCDSALLQTFLPEYSNFFFYMVLSRFWNLTCLGWSKVRVR